MNSVNLDMLHMLEEQLGTNIGFDWTLPDEPDEISANNTSSKKKRRTSGGGSGGGSGAGSAEISD